MNEWQQTAEQIALPCGGTESETRWSLLLTAIRVKFADPSAVAS